MHRLALVALLAALAPLPIALAPSTPRVTATALPLDPADPARRDIGRLRYIAGWRLRGTDRRFGGISSMTLQDGAFVMLNDSGAFSRFRLSPDGTASDYMTGELPGGPGAAWRKVNRDSESSTLDPASGHVWVGFETRNEIWRYTRGFARADGHVAPAAMAGWWKNTGAEAMTRLHDGRFLVFAEAEKNPDGSHVALMFPTDPVTGVKPVPFGVRGPDGFAVTDAAELPDGRVAILMRRFAPGQGLLRGAFGFSAALVAIDPRTVKAGDTLPSTELAQLRPPLTVDNMEALAVERRGDRTILWIASDDNFFALQRTLLMAFELRDGNDANTAPPRAH